MDQLTDAVAEQLPRDAQIHAARLAQDGFSHAFRLTLEVPAAERQTRIADAAKKLLEWVGETTDPARSSLRLGALLSGLDQWGLAYSQVFGTTAMTGLSELVSRLRAVAQDGAIASGAAIERINGEEGCAISFKAELRKAIHLALWHSMIADEDPESAARLLTQLGGMMLALLKTMPNLGWIVIANTLADIQIRCLAHGLASTGLAQEMTQQLFGALNRELPADQREKIMSSATQTVLAWQQSTKNTTAH
jgi:hypothetical protein